MSDLERDIAEWRRGLALHGAFGEEGLSGLETRLRASIEELRLRGLDDEEALLVAARRLGKSEAGAGAKASPRIGPWDIAVALGLSLIAGFLAKLPLLFGIVLDTDEGFAVMSRNAALYCLAPAAILLASVRAREAPALSRGQYGPSSSGTPSSPWIPAATLVGLCLCLALWLNLLPLATDSQTGFLRAIHLPFFLWICLLPLYAGRTWRATGKGMDFVRFTGESFIFCVLLICGVMVFSAFTSVIFTSAGFVSEGQVEGWLIVVGVFAAPVAAIRLALARRRLVEAIAPLLARIFGPLFLLAMLVFIVVTLASGRNPFEGRDILIAFDVLLAVIFALVLFSTALRDPRAAPGPGDWVDFGLAAAAMVLDLLLLSAIAGRIGTWGASPNRLAALGENVIILVELAGAAFLLGRNLLAGRPYAALLRWQTAFIGVIFVWCGIVALVFPLLFGGV